MRLYQGNSTHCLFIIMLIDNCTHLAKFLDQLKNYKNLHFTLLDPVKVEFQSSKGRNVSETNKEKFTENNN